MNLGEGLPCSRGWKAACGNCPRRFGRHSTDFSTFLNPPGRNCSPRHAPDLESGKTEGQAQDEPEEVRGGPAVGEKRDAPAGDNHCNVALDLAQTGPYFRTTDGAGGDSK